MKRSEEKTQKVSWILILPDVRKFLASYQTNSWVTNIYFGLVSTKVARATTVTTATAIPIAIS